MKRYLIVSLILTGLLSILYGLNHLLLQGFLHPHFIGLVIFFFLQSLAVAWMLREGEKDRSRLPLYALGSISFRFVSGILFVLIYIIAEVADLSSFIIQFMGLYLVYLVFELIVVLANLRQN